MCLFVPSISFNMNFLYEEFHSRFVLYCSLECYSSVWLGFLPWQTELGLFSFCFELTGVLFWYNELNKKKVSLLYRYQVLGAFCLWTIKSTFCLSMCLNLHKAGVLLSGWFHLLFGVSLGSWKIPYLFLLYCFCSFLLLHPFHEKPFFSFLILLTSLLLSYMNALKDTCTHSLSH